jgi:hypothetical protein
VPAIFKRFAGVFWPTFALGRPKLLRLLVGHFKDADRLVRQYGLVRQLRTLDALQLAVALGSRTRKLLDRFVCSDRQLLAVAVAEGMVVLDPENPSA